MKTSTLLKILLGMCLAWTGFIVPTWWRFSVIDRHADGYRTAWLRVESATCGTEGVRESCQLHGTIDGSAEWMSAMVPGGEPPVAGTRVKVLYNPGLAEGVGEQPLRVLEWRDDVREQGRRFRRRAVGLTVTSVLLTLGVHLLFLLGLRLRNGIGDGILEVDLGGARPALGVTLLGLGLTFVVWQAGRVAWAGLILGLLMVAAGAFLLRTRHLRLEGAERRLTLGRQLLGRRLSGITFAVPAAAPVYVSYHTGDFAVSVGEEPSSLEILRLPYHDDARRLGDLLARWLDAPLRDTSRSAETPQLTSVRSHREGES